jgi:ceramide glucosyltransferase
VCSQSGALSLLRQELRWARTNLLLSPLGYAGTLVTYPLPCAALALAFLGSSTLSLAALAAALTSRIYLVFRSARRFGWRREHFWLLPLRDTMSFYVYLASFFGKNVQWRGHRFATRADGALVPVWR